MFQCLSMVAVWSENGDIKLGKKGILFHENVGNYYFLSVCKVFQDSVIFGRMVVKTKSKKHNKIAAFDKV